MRLYQMPNNQQFSGVQLILLSTLNLLLRYGKWNRVRLFY